MSINLQQVALRRLLETKDHEFFSKLNSKYFYGINASLFHRIEQFYKANIVLPNLAELESTYKDSTLQEYLEQEIKHPDNIQKELHNGFILSQLQDFFIREETINFLSAFVDKMDMYEKEDIVDQLQNHLLELNKAIPDNEEVFDVAELSFFPSEDDFNIFPSGLSNEYDTSNGGFATQELVLLGGRRGSGKSIISLNLALTRYRQGNTVGFFSIEMRYKEVYDRLLSIISGVPFLDIFRNLLTNAQRVQIARAKFEEFYLPDPRIEQFIQDLEVTQNFKEFEARVKTAKLALKEHRLFIVDDESLTLNRLNHHCNTFKNKYPRFNLIVVDYLNIIKHDDQKDWKTQIVIADSLKSMARKYDMTVLSPYQIDASGEARFAKGILDSADRSFNFFPAAENDDRSLVSSLAIHTTKIRNGKHMSFNIDMDWSCVRIDPATSKLINEKPHNTAKFGSDNEKQGPKDV